MLNLKFKIENCKFKIKFKNITFKSLSLNYNFGNQKLKTSKRKTGLESESGRVN
jgi:hypothetical protein